MEYILNSGKYNELMQEIGDRKNFIKKVWLKHCSSYSISQNRGAYLDRGVYFDFGHEMATDVKLNDLYKELEALIMRVDK